MFTFTGNKAVSEGELVTFTEKCLVRNQPHDRVEAIDYCVLTTKDFLFSRGYLRAKVGEPALKESKNGRTIMVSVEDGPLFRLGHIEIHGATVLPATRIREMLNLKEGEIANADVIKEWLFEQLKNAYSERGYIRYTAEIELKFHPTDTEGTVDLTVTIDEGNTFQVKLIEFQGNGDIPGEYLLSLVSIRMGEIFTQAALEKSINTLNETSLFETIDANKDVDYRADVKNSELKLIIKLKRRT